MHVNITTKDYHLDAKLRSSIERKIAKLERHYNRITSVHLMLSVTKVNHRAEASVRVDGNELFAESVESDMRSAIDALTSKLERQISRHKDKVTRH
ncbi:MAG: ribosome-associated translation inhibitor RaiA [Gammaproteobacteria bacterium]|nr:ribosome-associated translation inhibitor RaiA [Gammaproteobacteria bacterium]MXX95627.1 ribosome-associated translation inhibitor RaiA [Gammaproteobacteria bacterium]MYF53960.1 ribosome-associated translation inhibitor RaiA [Gammaproteobacteria bacterium]MYK43682.1 ribosome-associated translation inhibitor RaiA [Gammaproteobacteria bacterium]